MGISTGKNGDGSSTGRNEDGTIFKINNGSKHDHFLSYHLERAVKLVAACRRSQLAAACRRSQLAALVPSLATGRCARAVVATGRCARAVARNWPLRSCRRTQLAAALVPSLATGRCARAVARNWSLRSWRRLGDSCARRCVPSRATSCRCGPSRATDRRAQGVFWKALAPATACRRLD
ncbi:hypothetical protein AXF42_Ash009098 [Apostasia shenzhenica]|uniref:Uncharacterized protein n=1 Tax=Apostasia shenzhenica TaxID=1088818 RepID=A0A2I0ADG8_9ASPA|nr:hypothetical protein AXF42_Ash009098 [Apostasia shenzhenica]